MSGGPVWVQDSLETELRLDVVDQELVLGQQECVFGLPRPPRSTAPTDRRGPDPRRGQGKGRGW